MNALHLMGMAMMLLCSACAPGSRESSTGTAGYVWTQKNNTPTSPVLPSTHQEWKQSEAQVVAYGQVLSYWSTQLRTGR